MENAATQKLRFRIVECTGEDPQHPVSELLTSSPQSNGWQSQRFCGFPQFITFQFLSPVLLKQIQFLSHENKISSKLELFTAMTDSKTPLPSSELKFRKLGFLTLDTNESSNYQLRELKTVYLESPCFYLRVAFHKCHINKFNFFNQVGLIAMAAYGEPIVVAPQKGLSPNTEKKEKGEPVTPMDEFTLRKIKELEEAKQKAVDAEAFEEAHRIKADISKIKGIGVQIQRLEDKRLNALKHDDFQNAEIMKKEIEKLRENINQIAIGNGGKTGPNTRKTSGNKLYTQNSSDQDSQRGSYQEIPDARPSVPNNRFSAKASAHRNSPNYKGDPDVTEELGDYDDDYFGQSNDTYDSTKEAANRVSYEDQVIPALKKKNHDILEEHPPQVTLPQEAEELSVPNQKLAEPLAPVVGAEMCKKIFSKHWNLREDALKTLTEEIPKGNKSNVINYTDEALAFTSLMGIVGHTIGDRLQQVSARSMSLLKALLGTKVPNGVGMKNDLANHVDNMMVALLEKIGDSNARVRDQAEDVLLTMARSSLVGCSFCVNIMVKSGTGKYKGGQTPKHIIGKLKTLQNIIKEFKINNHDVPYHPVLEYVTEKFEHPNADVRSVVVSILVDIHGVVGDKLKKDLDGMKLAHLEMLQKEFDNASGKGTGTSTGSPAKGTGAGAEKNNAKVTNSPVKNGAKGDAGANTAGAKAGNPKPETKPATGGGNDKSKGGNGAGDKNADPKNAVNNKPGDNKQADQQQNKPNNQDTKGNAVKK